MNDALTAHWNEARRQEVAGDTAAASAAYQAILALEPGQLVPWLRLSRFAQAADRYVEARAHALQAAEVAIGQRHGKDAGFVTLRLLAFAEDATVARVIQSLDWDSQEVLKQAPILAQHLWLVGHHPLSLDFLAHAGKRVRPDPRLSLTRANVLRSLGRLEEATQHYEYALQLDPDHAAAHQALASHRPDGRTPARVVRIKAALDRQPAHAMEQARLGYALFKELDALDDTQAAWKALEQATSLMRREVRHDPFLQAERMRELVRRPHAGNGQGGNVSEGPVPLFIVGLPRTGTTLLDRILGNHPQVVSLGERNDFDASVSEAADHFYPGALQEPNWDRLQDLDPAKAGEIYLRRLAPEAAGYRYFIDKNPQNFFNIGLILRALPQARILCLRRDAMDACFSNLKEPFDGGAYAYSYSLDDLARHHQGFEALLHHWQVRSPEAVRVVDYEAIVRDGAATVESLLGFLGLPACEGLLDIAGNASPVSTASSTQVREPIHDRNIGAWRRYAAQLEPLRHRLDART